MTKTTTTKPKVASTKRKAGTKTTQARSSEKEVAFLTPEEVIGFDLRQMEQEKIRAEISASELVSKNHQLEMEIHRLKCQVEATAQAELRNKLAMSRKKALDYQTEIKNKYQIKSDKFGYNPDTGQLIEE